ncbi:unnamed protein product [Moneuplotes crassus]|uniref:Uncharacterized protein n=1 Tax=Euplotes crassus TaxID=5936 RepID=A0AAD1XQE0_EUPCR|nr:unnamed protein product [Moneuplotes crassus]
MNAKNLGIPGITIMAIGEQGDPADTDNTVFIIGKQSSQFRIISYDITTDASFGKVYTSSLAYPYFGFMIKKFYKNSVRNAIFVTPKAIKLYSVTGNDLGALHQYDFGTSNYIRHPKILSGDNYTYIVAIECTNSNTISYLDLDSSGNISVFRKFAHHVVEIYSAMYNDLDQAIEIYTISGATVSLVSIFPSNQTAKVLTELNSVKNIFYYFEGYYKMIIHSSTDLKQTRVIKDRLKADYKEYECVLHNLASPSVPTPEDRSTGTFAPHVFSTTVGTFSDLTVTPTGGVALISPISSCTSYLSTPLNRASQYSMSYSVQSPLNVKIPNLFCIQVGYSLASMNLAIIYQNGSNVDWISFNTTDGSLTGTAPQNEANYTFTVTAFMVTGSLEYTVSLEIESCADSNCEKCNPTDSCIKCKDNYELTSEHKCTLTSATLSSSASSILGATSVGVTIGVVGGAVLLSQLNPRSSFQGLFTVSEYFQLLLTLLLLDFQLPEVVYELVDTFGAFKLDLSFIRNIYSSKSVFNPSKVARSNERYSKIGIDYESTGINYSIVIGVMVIFIICNLILLLACGRTQCKTQCNSTSGKRGSLSSIKLNVRISFAYTFISYSFIISM